jgi:hypothetical protein
MVRLTDQEMTTIRKVVCYPQTSREGACHPIGGHMGKHQGQSGGKERGWNCG